MKEFLNSEHEDSISRWTVLALLRRDRYGSAVSTATNKPAAANEHRAYRRASLLRIYSHLPECLADLEVGYRGRVGGATTAGRG